MSDLDLSLVLVAHHSSAVLPAALAAFRREAATVGLAAETVVVDHSEDAGEAEGVAASRPDRLLVLPNRGFAAGINAGVAAARGRRLLLGNADVELGPGSLAPLLAALEDSWGVVGPQFELAGFRFPPADPQGAGAELARHLAPRGERGWGRFMRREMERWRRVWEAQGTVAVPTLSGALLACSRATFDRLGPWDEGYFLYFEETDWLRRAPSVGVRAGIVTAATATHRWGHSAHPGHWEPRFAASRARYYRRHHPLLAPLLLALPGAPPPAPRSWEAAPTGEDWRWLLSPSPTGFPAALLTGAAPVERAAAELCAAVGRADAHLIAWRPADGALAGPFRWPPAAGAHP